MQPLPSPPPEAKREISETKILLVDLTLDLPFSVYKNNPAKFEKQLIKEISVVVNIDPSRIRFTGARKG